MDAKQQKTFVGIVLIVVLGAAACCGLTVAIGAFIGYQDALQAATGALDAGTRRATGPQPTTTPPDDEAPGDDALKQRFVDEVLAGLADAGRPDYAYQAETFDLVTDAGAQISLDNLYAEYAEKDEDQRPDFVDRTVRGFFPAEVPTTWEAARKDIVVTVRDRMFIELLAINADKPLNVLRRPLSDDLVELVVYDGPDSMQYLNEDHLADWGKNADEVFLEGRKHLVARSREAFQSPSPGVYESPWADNHDIGRALLFETLRRLKVKGDPVLFLPQRDHLLVTGSDDEEGLMAVADLVTERLALPRANTGRGWRLTRKGLEPFIPPASAEVLTVLRLEAAAKDANEQKKALDERFARDGTDLFVGTTLFTDDDDGKQRTYCVWTKDADSLMPRAEFIVFVDLDMPEADRVVAAAPWDEVIKRLGNKVKPDDSYWPRRYRVQTFPDARTLKALGTHPFFRRNKEE